MIVEKKKDFTHAYVVLMKQCHSAAAAAASTTGYQLIGRPESIPASGVEERKPHTRRKTISVE